MELHFPLVISPAALLSWNLISLVDLSAFLIMQFDGSRAGYLSKRNHLVSYFICMFSSLAVFLHAIFHFIWAVEGDQWFALNSKWAKLAGFERIYSWTPPSEFYFLFIQTSIAFVSLRRVSGVRHGQDLQGDSHLECFYSSLGDIGSHLRTSCCLLLPAVQLVVGISSPSWTSFPFFICSCIGLVDWSLTSNFLGLFRSNLRYGNLSGRTVFQAFSINFFTYGFPVGVPHLFL
ncbi:hypothetical protein BT93_B1378 [Corymbia citriodora subsp. variegata]|nr:hypothetical protein BT93_B1378 [Corymbia citriodora subsp. variegata]